MTGSVKTAKFLRAARILTHTPIHRTPAKPVGLYLLELRSHVAEMPTQAALSKRKLVITLDPGHTENGQPKPIKITHV